MFCVDFVNIYFQVNGVMAFLYLTVGTVWVFLWARSHQHTLRIHLVIGGVAVAGESKVMGDGVEEV